MYALLLTLGHNSSALALNTKTGEMLGYEEERLTRIKSDSSFPAHTLAEISKHIPADRVTAVYVSHWFDNFDPWKTTKYWDPDFLLTNFPRITKHVYTDADFTHHDAHAWSSLAFTKEAALHCVRDNDTYWHTLVIDGFGTNAEVISLYRVEPFDDMIFRPVLVTRVQGYDYSLGLMFQYAAEAQGMDGINDVYKFLGYQAQVTDDVKSSKLVKTVIEAITESFTTFTENAYEPAKDSSDLINYAALKHTRETMKACFSQFDRPTTGYIIQEVIERVVLRIVDKFSVVNLMTSGGCFYNVKLNNALVRRLTRFSPMPLAGDQGAAIGVYEAHRSPDQAPPRFGDLCWGPRPMEHLSRRNDMSFDTFYVRDTFVGTMHEIANKLNRGEIVNIVRPRAEFGPRALCRTTTLAPPTPSHVEFINAVNGRNTIMPMAPVITYEEAVHFFNEHEIDEVTVGSEKFMICSYDYEEGYAAGHEGAALREGDLYTGRPQVVYEDVDPALYALLTLVHYALLINTSFNGHGDPIILTHPQAAALHRSWAQKSQTMTNAIPFSTYVFIDE